MKLSPNAQAIATNSVAVNNLQVLKLALVKCLVLKRLQYGFWKVRKRHGRVRECVESVVFAWLLVDVVLFSVTTARLLLDP